MRVTSNDRNNDTELVLPVLAPQQLLRTNENNSSSVIEIVQPSEFKQKSDKFQHHHHHDSPFPQDMCYDKNGYYFNNHGQQKQCSWLINSRCDPTDETSMVQSCGHRNSEYPEGTDLGRM